MNVQVNGKPIEIKVSAVSTLQDILLQVETLMPRNQIVTGGKLNGRELESDWTAHATSIYILAEDVLEFSVENAAELGARVFAESRGHLHRIIDQVSTVADRFRMDDEAVANTHFVQSIDMLQAYFNVLQETSALRGVDFTSMQTESRTVASMMEDISGKLSDLIDIQKNQDWVLLADVLEYELIPLLKQLDSLY